MQQQEAIQQLLGAARYFEQQSAGYKSWGKVEVVQIALRLSDGKIISTDKHRKLSEITEADIIMEKENSLYHTLFEKRKKVQVILLTRQEYAAQVTKEIPPILDDQAQLLGVSVRIAKEEQHILKALNGRFAAIVQNGDSICLGNSLEDAYVAAQLLEKTSKAFIEAEYLGGAKSINRIEAWLMQQFYQFKYSKEAKKNK
jgi:ribulose-5-phosphate 4-epimerase/fuculose-1-phosphate aldolase